MTKTLALLASAVLGMAADASVDSIFQAIRNNDLAALRAIKDVNVKDDRGITPLMYCAFAGSAEGMRIVIDKGANVNAKNAFESTALMWSVPEIAKVRMLVEKGADVNAVSKIGRSALMFAAMSGRGSESASYLISKGANLKIRDMTGNTMLTAAAAADNIDLMRKMIDAGIDVNAADGAGFTALMASAANSNTAAVKLLIAKGANVNAVSADSLPGGVVKNGPIALGKFTALTLAAATGPPDLVKALLDAGAKVNVQEIRGLTPLMIAVATDHGSPEIVKMLLAKGADRNIKSKAGETAADWARKAGATESMKAIAPGADVKIPVQTVSASTVNVRAAAEKSLALMEKTTGGFFVNGGCSACHAQNVLDIAARVAKQKGFAVDAKLASERQKLNKAFYGPMIPNLLERLDPPGSTDVISYAITGLAASGYVPDRMTDGMVADLAAQQYADGRWHTPFNPTRPPMEDSDFFRTALGIQALKVYAPPARRADGADQINRASAWLMKAKPVTAEDRNYQMLGLKWAGAADATLRPLAQAAIALQRPDGGWSQTAELSSDAFATGQTLYVLAELGIKDAAFEKGVRFLLGTQKPDGSWYVASRSPKFQPYFESGFPHGHDQWISSMATGWATAALAYAAEARPSRAAE
jgi:ankyrin repeat protein